MAQLVGRRRGQTAGGGSIPRWSASKPQVVTRRKAKGAGQKKRHGGDDRDGSDPGRVPLRISYPEGQTDTVMDLRSSHLTQLQSWTGDLILRLHR